MKLKCIDLGPIKIYALTKNGEKILESKPVLKGFGEKEVKKYLEECIEFVREHPDDLTLIMYQAV